MPYDLNLSAPPLARAGEAQKLFPAVLGVSENHQQKCKSTAQICTAIARYRAHRFDLPAIQGCLPSRPFEPAIEKDSDEQDSKIMAIPVNIR